MSRGVVLISVGSAYYGGWALNLAMGIKHTDPNMNITLLWKEQGKQYIQPYLYIFDEVIEIEEEHITSNGQKSYLKSKTHLYDLSPYHETIFIDADVMWFPFKQISTLFDSLKGCDFTMGNRSKNDLHTDPKLLWVKADELADKHEAFDIYNLSSEFIYFKKTEKIKSFFDKSKHFFDNPGVDYNRFAGSVPDELAFQIAMIYSDIIPHKTPYLPFYWEAYEKKNKTAPELYKEDWYGYSMGGCTVSHSQKYIYDSLAKFYSNNFGVKYPFLSQNKRDVLQFRKHI